MNQPKRVIKMNRIDLLSAFEHRDPLAEIDEYLDLETGKVEMITGEERRLLYGIYEAHADPETGEVDWPAVLPQLDVADWQKERLPLIREIEGGFGTRFLEIPQDSTSDEYSDMEAFIVTVSNPRLQERLERAISGKGAFRYFRDVLDEHPKERERWYQFSNERVRQRILDWLEIEGIEPIWVEKKL